MKGKRKFDFIEIDYFRGINILFENDFYELALVMLKIMDGMQSYENVISRPSINGVASQYSFICGGKIDSKHIVDIVQNHLNNDIDGNETIDFDQSSNRQVMKGEKYY